MSNLEEPLGAPDLQIAGLRLWVHGRQFPMADDYWDGNWLQVTVHCAAPGAHVWVTGPILHVSEIAHFLRGVEAMHTSLQGEATLPCLEPECAVTLTAQELGHITMVVAITPDHLSQTHRFTFTIDQSYLPQVIDSCRTLLRRYPVKGQPQPAVTLPLTASTPSGKAVRRPIGAPIFGAALSSDDSTGTPPHTREGIRL